MSARENMATQERMANAVNSDHLDDLDDVFSPNVVDHDPAPNQAPGPAGFKHFFATLRDAFPDLNIINIRPTTWTPPTMTLPSPIP